MFHEQKPSPAESMACVLPTAASGRPRAPGSKPIRAADPATHMIRLTAAIVAATGLSVLIGWLGDWPLIKSVLPGAVEMKANTALGLLAAGAALWWLDRSRSNFFYYGGQALALFVTLLGLATLGQYLFDWQLGIDELLFLDSQGRYNLIRGRMSPYTAAGFVSIGLALLMLPHAGLRALASLASLAATLPLVLGSMSALGYAWNATELTTDIFLPPMAVHATLAFVLLSAGTLLAIRKCLALQTSVSFTTQSIEGKILLGLACSLLLLAVGAGATYKATTVFASSAQMVAHVQRVRTTLSQLHASMTDLALAQRNYLITGQAQQRDEFSHQQVIISERSRQIRALLRNDKDHEENLALLEPLVERTRALLSQGIALYQRGGFDEAQKMVSSGQSLRAMQSLFAVIQRMDGVEAGSLIEREAASARFQRHMLISMLLTTLVAASIFAALYLEIRREMQARQRATEALISSKDLAEAARREADAANLAKSNFLATMSHEIRTPMNGVLGMLELLSLSPLDGSQRSTLNVIRESGRSLMRIIDDILDFSKIEAEKLDIQPEVTSLQQLMEDVHRIYAGNASSKRLLVTCRVDAALSPASMVDPVRLRQILDNFVSNAIKFTSSGQIDLTAELIERLDGEDRVLFSVKDTGIGISEAHQRNLFQPFAQAELSTTRRYGGTGLGLAICRRLAALMGGSVSMVSTPGQGTTMLLALTLPMADPALLTASHSPSSGDRLFATPASTADCRTAPSVAQAEAEGTLILLADDHPTNRSLLVRQLNLLGYAAESAINGVEALRLWQSGRFALLLTDCNMPGMDGYELAKYIRALESATRSRRFPIIACTANALGGEAEICLEAGMDDYLAKPVALSDLRSQLGRWLPLPGTPVDVNPVIGAPVTAAPVAVPVPAPAGAATRIPIDRSVLARVSSGDAAVESKIFIEFQRANAGDAARLQQAVSAADSGEVTRLAHLIKGACAMVGATGLAEICEGIEHANRRGDWNSIVARMSEFHLKMADLNHYIDEYMAQARPQATLDERPFSD